MLLHQLQHDGEPLTIAQPARSAHLLQLSFGAANVGIRCASFWNPPACRRPIVAGSLGNDRLSDEIEKAPRRSTFYCLACQK